MNTLDENEKKLLLQELKERLDFYTFQASEEQFDARKVEVLVKQIRELESEGDGTEQEGSESGVAGQAPRKLPTADFEAFQRYREEKAADAERLAVLNGTGRSADAEHLAASDGENRDGASGKASRGFYSVYARWTGSSRLLRAAVVGIAVLLAVGGSIGVANAAKDWGLIQWLKKNVYGEAIVVEPEKGNLSQDGLEGDMTAVYSSAEELPEPYREYFVDLEGMEGLEGYEQGQIVLYKHSEGWRLTSCWQAPEQENLFFRIWSTEHSVIVYDGGFDDFEEVYKKEVKGVEFHVCKKPDHTGEKDVTIYFYQDNKKYIVDGKLSLEAMEQLAIGYAERILEKNKNF